MSVSVANRVEIKEGLKECWDREKWTDGWFFLPDGRPARFDWSMKTTYDPTEDGMEFPYFAEEKKSFGFGARWRCSRAQKNGKDLKSWNLRRLKIVVVMIMERKLQEVSRYIHQQKKENEKKPQEEASSSSGDKKDKMDVDAQEKLEARLPTIGEDEFEEKMIVGGVEPTPESSLKELKQACKLLGVGATGSKQLLWQF